MNTNDESRIKSISAELPEIHYRPKDDPEYCSIKDDVVLIDFITYMKDKDLFNIRLPVNNPEAYNYLRWLNEFFITDNNHINFLLNLWDENFITSKGKKVRPPTAREVAIVNARSILNYISDKDVKPSERGMMIDFAAGFIGEAYQFWSYPIWIEKGLAGCVMKWGTFEDNMKEGETYTTYEEDYWDGEKDKDDNK